VDAAAIVQLTYDGNALTGTRMLRVLDQNFKGLFLGSMSSSRKVR
jgi:hypothetical protein